MPKPVLYHECQQMRRTLIKSGVHDMRTGKTVINSEEWVTRKCATPLFGDNERKAGICRSCASGWTHPENYPVTTE
jgi:hypothetical protein